MKASVGLVIQLPFVCERTGFAGALEMVSTSRAAIRENRASGFPTWSDTNRAVQSQKMIRNLKFRI